MNCYEMLGVAPGCDFPAIKKAYYRRAKECHPDHFPGRPDKAEEFKALVEAFNILSDPMRREIHDAALFPDELAHRSFLRRGRVMDAEYDDILEELIVGNRMPRRTTLMTLFLDLQKTDVFIAWREAQDAWMRGSCKQALDLLGPLLRRAPNNILFRVCAARCHARLGEHAAAARCYRAALSIGRRRDPPQRLDVVRAELERLLKRKNPVLHRIRRFFLPEERAPELPADEQLVRETERAMAKALSRRSEAKRIERI